MGKPFDVIKQNLAAGQGIGYSLFGAADGISRKDISIFKNYFSLLDGGAASADELQTSLRGLSVAGQAVLPSLQSGEMTLEQLSSSAVRAGTGMKFLAAAGNMALSMLAMFAVQKAFQGMEYLANRSAYVAEEFKKAADESRESFKKSSSETKSLDELIAKYEELATSGKEDASTREQIKGIQEEINGLVSSEAGSMRNRRDYSDPVDSSFVRYSLMLCCLISPVASSSQRLL